ncbi:hypothetical protein A2415_01540 [candidate division WWE3 bacterium RIFOXYC1_FULL_39_7]|uniref:Uncharacterized protein n=2 Tax=Katanobacteria TaxID=422282 RepID=A0A1F4X4Z3_UNCKA|nr:MAG: hypothetical protein A2415_01540 [candidate division WWE3 bacterium RIFOXYC1_FULL_39_7]OGC76784.1 MAG: hypothetical protein A2619_00465 [candidate division WWE3 bacterium RIFOXYD1_FULL_39_9]
MDHLSRLFAWHSFANDLCTFMGWHAYVAVSAMLIKKHAALTYGAWAGTPPEDIESRAPHVAYGKLGEMILLDGARGNHGKLIMTPIEGNELSYGWMGACAVNGIAVAVSKWTQEADKLLALLTLYNAAKRPLTLHHVGRRFASQGAYDAANILQGVGMKRPKADHERMYFPRGGRYLEHQYFPNGLRVKSQHWDVQTPDPDDFLKFVAGAYNLQPELWEEEDPNDPRGVVWIDTGDEGPLGVMARESWWSVERD